MNVVVLGASGQLACCLRERLPNAVYLGRERLDFERDAGQFHRLLATLEPDCIVNAVACTGVDQAEEQPDRASQVNALAVEELALACRQLDAALVHVSTDYVFSGDSERGWQEADTTDPLNQYGVSKLQGERALADAELDDWWILRTSWLFSEHGNNFVRGMLRLAGDREALTIVSDQRGRPTYAGDLADVVVALIERLAARDPVPSGIYHCASAGDASWYQFAQEIFRRASALGLVATVPELRPISSQDYRARALRPRNSCLDTGKLEAALGWQPPCWLQGLDRTLEALVVDAASPAEPTDAQHAASTGSAAVSASSSDPFIVFGAPALGDAEIEEVVACLRSGWLGSGPRVAQFELAFRQYRQARHAVAVSSCSAALHLSLLALELEPGAEVITTPLTFCATVNAIVHAGLTPVLADIDPVTMNLDPDAVAACITPRTGAILPVHFAGRPCEMDRLMALARRHGLKVVEDCAHAVEATFHGQPVGTFGDFGCFSFYVNKNVTTGEGGMVLARSARHQQRIRAMAHNGLSKDAWNRFGDEGYKHYEIVDCGFKYNMTDLSAAIGIRQLEQVQPKCDRRTAIWQRYQTALAALPLTLPAPVPDHIHHARHLYTVLVEEERCGINRDQFIATMTRLGIGVGVHYRSLPEHPYYRQRFGWQPEAFPHATRAGQTTVSLPLSARLTDAEVERVISAARQALALQDARAHG